MATRRRKSLRPRWETAPATVVLVGATGAGPGALGRQARPGWSAGGGCEVMIDLHHKAYRLGDASNITCCGPRFELGAINLGCNPLSSKWRAFSLNAFSEVRCKV